MSRQKIKCGAHGKTTGKPCTQWAVTGMKRCKMHGGITKTRGNTTAVKPGTLYSKYLTDEERKSFDNVELGTVDAELRLMRIRLSRALKAEHEQTADATEIEVRIERDGGGPATVGEERHYKRRDHKAIIQATLARIESLEKTRKELLEAGEGGEGEEPTPQTFVFEVVDGRK